MLYLPLVVPGQAGPVTTCFMPLLSIDACPLFTVRDPRRDSGFSVSFVLSEFSGQGLLFFLIALRFDRHLACATSITSRRALESSQFPHALTSGLGFTVTSCTGDEC